MARPRVYIRVRQKKDGTWQRLEKGGTEVPGVSYHQPTGQFYTIPSKGERAYLGVDLEPIVKKFLLRETDFEIIPVTALQELENSGIKPEAIESLPEEYKSKLDDYVAWELPGFDKWIEANKDSDPAARFFYNDMMVKTGYPEKQLPPLPCDEKDELQREPSNQKLRDIINLWVKYKNEEGCQKGYVKDVQRVFNHFIKHIGNKSISELNADDFARWRRWIVRHAKGKSNKWRNDHNRQVQTVLTTIKQEKPLWPFPDGLKEWASSWKAQKHVVKKSNKMPMPVEMFKKVLEIATKWSATDVDQYSKETQRGWAQRLQAKRKRIEGFRCSHPVLHVSGQTHAGPCAVAGHRPCQSAL